MNTQSISFSNSSPALFSISGIFRNAVAATRATRRFIAVLAFAVFSTASVAQADSSSAGAIDKININNANAEALQFIPGIGPSKANAILEHRAQHGEFKSMSELLEVKGVGEKLLEKIEQYGTLEGGVSELTQQMIDNPPTKTLSLWQQENPVKLS